MKLIEQRLLESYLVGVRPKADAIKEKAAAHLKALRPDGSWADIDYKNRSVAKWAPAGHISRIRVMALSWRLQADAGHDDAALKTGTLKALDGWIAKDLLCPNWWYNEIGVPMNLAPTLLAMKNEMGAARLKKALRIMARSKLGLTGANLVWLARNCVATGCVAGDAALVREALRQLFSEIKYAGVGKEGIQADYSFHQHGSMLYSGGYGAAFSSDVAQFLALAHGTGFAATKKQTDIFTAFLLDGQRWMGRGIRFDYSVIGREITRPNHSRRGLRKRLATLAEASLPRRDELAHFAELLATDSKAKPLSGNRHFWRSDYMVHHRDAFMISVRMFSARTLNSELVNGEGTRSHHLADGVTYIYRSGEEYHDLFPAWDWQRPPGALVEQRAKHLSANTVKTRGKSTFVGGVSDGTCGLAAMDFTRLGLTGRRAWFCFDQGMLALGAGLRASSKLPVRISINQCHLKGPVQASGKTLEQGTHKIPARGWAWHDGVGYALLNVPGAVLQADTQSGSWRNVTSSQGRAKVELPTFSLWGDLPAAALKDPAGAQYAYAVLPGLDAQATAAWMQAHEKAAPKGLKVLANNESLQAAFDGRKKVLAAAFWKPGRVDGGKGWRVQVDQPCLVLLSAEDQGLRVAVCNPENKPLKVKLVLDAALGGPQAHATDEGGTALHFDLPGGAQAGRSEVRHYPLR